MASKQNLTIDDMKKHCEPLIGRNIVKLASVDKVGANQVLVRQLCAKATWWSSQSTLLPTLSLWFDELGQIITS